jgi:hypothetical protein
MPRRSRPKRTTKTVSHRVPPKPASWFCDRGTCRFCGEPIIENGKVNGRKHWHTPCALVWNVMNNPSEARLHVTRRENFTCEECGYHNVDGRFEVDHIKPLFEAKGDPTYWQSPNLMLLCLDCHKIKTKADMIRFRAMITCDDPLTPD